MRRTGACRRSPLAPPVCDCHSWPWFLGQLRPLTSRASALLLHAPRQAVVHQDYVRSNHAVVGRSLAARSGCLRVQYRHLLMGLSRPRRSILYVICDTRIRRQDQFERGGQRFERVLVHGGSQSRPSLPDSLLHSDRCRRQRTSNRQTIDDVAGIETPQVGWFGPEPLIHCSSALRQSFSS